MIAAAARRTWCALARERHFGRAAAACHVSQPTLSAGIRRLEDELGFPIVRRIQRYEGLTPEGERVLDWAHADPRRRRRAARRARRDAQRALGAAAARRDPDVAAVGLAPDDPAAARRHPGVTVSVHSLNSRQIERGLHDFELELGLTYLDSEPLTRRAHAAALRRALHAAHAGRRAARGATTVAWADAADAPLCLLTADMQNRRIVDGIFREAGAAPQPDDRDELDLDALRPRARRRLVERGGARLAAPVRRPGRAARDPPRRAGDDALDRARLARPRPRAAPRARAARGRARARSRERSRRARRRMTSCPDLDSPPVPTAPRTSSRTGGRQAS